MPKAKIRDIEMYYEIHGEGEPLVMIQGMGAEISTMGFDTRKPGKYRWLLFDNRGAGRTDKPAGPYFVEQMAADTLGLMDHLGISRAHFMGGSLGSRISLFIAAKHPERVNGLVLVCAAARSPHKDNPQMAAAYDQLRAQIRLPGAVNMMGKYPPTVDSMLAQLDAFMEFDGTGLLGSIRAPTLIINAREDASIPANSGQELTAGIHGSKLIMVDGNHFFVVAKPELLFTPMYEFLEEADKKSAAAAPKPGATSN